ncbi:hypothetical protein [Streptomyces altiplanensis]
MPRPRLTASAVPAVSTALVTSACTTSSSTPGEGGSSSFSSSSSGSGDGGVCVLDQDRLRTARGRPLPVLAPSMLFVSRVLAVVRDTSDEVAVVRHGRVVEHGPCQEAGRAPAEPYTRRLPESVPPLPAPENR